MPSLQIIFYFFWMDGSGQSINQIKACNDSYYVTCTVYCVKYNTIFFTTVLMSSDVTISLIAWYPLVQLSHIYELHFKLDFWFNSHYRKRQFFKNVMVPWIQMPEITTKATYEPFIVTLRITILKFQLKFMLMIQI